jgi:riboflavin synthase
MFTGIIEEIGVVQAIERGEQSARFTIQADKVTEDVAIGDSITVNGTCLTVVHHASGLLAFEAVFETLQKTALGALAIGDVVNLERSLAANGRFGGHIVQGHVDGVGTIASIRAVDNSYYIYITARPSQLRYIVRKGSIAVDGISLTVVEADDKMFSVSIIPHTWEHTNLHTRRAGDTVNLETDIIGKYVERLLGDAARSESSTGIADLDRRGNPLLGTATLYRE